MTERVMVTGGGGFIGSHLVKALLKQGYEVFVLDRLNETKISLDGKKANLISADITDKKRIDSVIKDTGTIDFVFHLAAQVSVAFGEANPEENRKINVDGTRNILDLAKACNAKGFVFFSSAAVYGDAKSFPIKETDPTEPINQYGLSKLKAEALCLKYTNSFDVVIIRPFNVYGPKQKPGDDVVSVFIDKISKGEPLTFFGDGSQTRDFIFVDDVVSFSVSVLKNTPVRQAVFNVGTGKETTIKELAELLMKLKGTRVPVVHLKEHPREIKRSVADISKIKALGFEPTPLEEGLKKTLGRMVR